jgi:hypothetical protein
MKKNLAHFVSVICLLCHFSLFAQDVPKWKMDLGSQAKWMKILPTGSIAVSTNKSFICVDPTSQQKIWELKDIGQVNQETFEEVQGTPFAMFESQTLKSLKTQTTIFNYVSGKVIYNTLEANVSIIEKTPLLDLGALLLELKQDKKSFLALVDIESGKERWRFELLGRKSGALASLSQGIKSSLDANPVSDKDGNILYPDGKIVKRIEGQTGTVLWQNENEKTVGRLNFSEDGSVIYLGSGSKIKALSLADGKDVWKDPFKISGEFKMFIPSSNNEMYVVTSSSINRIDNAAGKSVWKKPFVLANSFASLKFTSDGILVFSTDEKTSAFDYVGFNGIGIWKRAYTTSLPIVSFELTQKGILFANAEEANMVDLKTGDDTIWKKRIKLKGSPVTYIDEKIALVYSDEKLYRINMETVTYEQIADNIKFKGSDEDVRNIELVEGNYLLSSSQNMWLITPEGKVGYSAYYKAASFGGTAGKILGAVAKVYATYDNLEMTQDPTRPNTVNIQRSQKGDDIVGGINEVIANRKKSFSTQDSNYIMTFVETPDGKRVGMVKVNKLTGAESGKIVLKTMDPIYETDYATGQLFVIVNGVATGSELSSFGL